jgi:ribonucleotide monophosphatase NagD (HAD superfamily)
MALLSLILLYFAIFSIKTLKGPLKLKKLKHLSEIYNDYDTFIIDLWGVMHDGIRMNSGALEVIENLYISKKRIVFLSNAPRPSENVRLFLRKLNMDEKFLNNIITSGEAAIKSLGPQRDTSLFKGLEKNKTKLNNCDFILCTGLFDEHKDLNFYFKLLENNTKKKLVCTNPDLLVHKGIQSEYCAGKIAEIFNSLGGEVVYFGKPHNEVYNLILKKNEKNLVIGDNLKTDIKGANNLGLDSLFVTNGVHRSEFKEESNLDELLNNYNVKTQFFQKELNW